jgi:glycosyltransferase involved in cell wall biosynthesis
MTAAKPVIVHVIDSLARGGAETLLINLLDELNRRYEIILVTLMPENDFSKEEVICKKFYCLGYTGVRSLYACVRKLRGIIKEHNPSLVRSQLFISSIVARIATPRQIPLVFSIHNTMSLDSYSRNRFALPLEKLTYHKRHTIIGVSEEALNDFNHYVGIKGESHVLYNFINPVYFKKTKVNYEPHFNPLRIVAVGNLREQKNYLFLLHAIKSLKALNISLDIFGEGPLKEPLQQIISQNGLNVRLRGKTKDIYNHLPDYDLFIMTSLYEGFGIATAEAMAVGLPLILTDLPVFREVSKGNALFFKSNDLPGIVSLLYDVFHGKHDLKALSAKGIDIARHNYSKEMYVQKLEAIYSSLIQPKKSI